MKEELRFFIRIGVYAAGIGVVYWFLSYESAGTALLAAVALACLVFAVTVAVRAPGARRTDADARGATKGRLNRALGFAETEAAGEPAPLALEEEPLPRLSLWPFVAALAALAVGLGLIFGAWLWVPGALMGTAAAALWATEVR